jgi:general secretion pathway protein L
LPAGVRNMIGPVLRNQLERLAPWPADQACFAWRETSATADGTQVEVDLWIAGRARIEQLLRDLASAGLVPGVVDVGSTAEPEPSFNLIGKAGPDLVRARRTIERLMMAGAAITVLVTGGALGLAYQFSGQRDELETSIQRQLKAAAVSPREAELRRQRERVIAERRQSASVAIALEALSRAIPDGAYLERIELAEGVMTLAGKSSQVPSLIGLLEETGHFADVRFAAPTTRRPGEALDDFSLSMRLKPSMRLKGER